MPGTPHEATHQFFRDDPMVVPCAFRAAGVDVGDPDKIVEVNIDATQWQPLERRCDSVFLGYYGNEKHVYIIESQTDRDKAKRQSWPHYIGYMHDKYKCPVSLLVTCTDRATAAWAEEVIKIGTPERPSMAVWPAVFGPDTAPAVLDENWVRANVELAALTVVARRYDAKPDGILKVMAAGLDSEETNKAAKLARFIDSGLGDTLAGRRWRDLMAVETYGYVSEFQAKLLAEGRAEGRAEGEAKAVLRVLGARGITLTDRDRDRILSCTDIGQLEAWLDRAVVADTIDEVLPEVG